MKKTLVLGDIHGNGCWKDIVERENPDLTVFLGDYVSTHMKITEDEQIRNLNEILDFKEENKDKVILLRGNHDTQHLGYAWAECSGFFRKVCDYMCSIKDRFLDLTQWVYIEDDIIFTHAGITDVWLSNNKLNLETLNDVKPCEVFGFCPDNIFDYTGTSVTQPCTWIRPEALATANINGYRQVVGHTPVKRITNISKITKGYLDIWLCDCLPKEFVVIEDTVVIVKPFNDEKAIMA